MKKDVYIVISETALRKYSKPLGDLTTEFEIFCKNKKVSITKIDGEYLRKRWHILFRGSKVEEEKLSAIIAEFTKYKADATSFRSCEVGPIGTTSFTSRFRKK
jgi:hypothetical protein